MSSWRSTIFEKTKQTGTPAGKGVWVTLIQRSAEISQIFDQRDDDQTRNDRYSKAIKITKEYGPYVVGAIGANIAVPVVLSLLGFTSDGIGEGSLASICQSIGMKGLGLGGKTLVAAGGVWAVRLYKNVYEKGNKGETDTAFKKTD